MSDSSPPAESPSHRAVQFSPVVNVHSHSSTTTFPSLPPEPSQLQQQQQQPALGRSSDQSVSFESGVLRRRETRSNTFRTVTDIDDAEEGEDKPPPPGWEPGSEPGITQDDGVGQHLVWCDVHVVEFSQENVRIGKYDNQTFPAFLEQPQEDWVKCRWISINGLSTDVVSAVGRRYGLHELALEDMMNPKNRTKADWYPNHAFILLTLQKTVDRLSKEELLDRQSAADASGPASARGLWDRLRQWRAPVPEPFDFEKSSSDPLLRPVPAGYGPPPRMQTLQRYHSSARNLARTRWMEHNSSLLPQNLVVMAEQVSIFLTSDNTVISFFQSSAPDVETQLIKRIEKRGTILREWCDASLLVQAIIDNIVDLAMPLTQAYAMAIDDIELDVLTKPDIEQCMRLYICISEINKMLTFLNPIDNMVNVIRDHRTDLSQAEALKQLRNPAAGVIVTPMTSIYMGDILDHCIIITEAMAQLKQSADNLINLIFNRISANQNDSMRALTIVTILFLPMTFITGFFGQNFEPFPEIYYGINYFWIVATPTAVVTFILVMRNPMVEWVRAHLRQRGLASMRKNRQLLIEAKRAKKAATFKAY